MRRNFSERSLLVTLYLTLLFGSGLVPERVDPSPQTGEDCKPVQVKPVN